MNEWKMENTGLTRLDTGYGPFGDLLDGSYVGDVIDAIERMKMTFGDNFEKLYEWEKKYEGKAYFKNIHTGGCRCGSCDDVLQWWLHVNR